MILLEIHQKQINIVKGSAQVLSSLMNLCYCPQLFSFRPLHIVNVATLSISKKTLQFIPSQ